MDDKKVEGASEVAGRRLTRQREACSTRGEWRGWVARTRAEEVARKEAPDDWSARVKTAEAAARAWDLVVEAEYEAKRRTAPVWEAAGAANDAAKEAERKWEKKVQELWECWDD